jgi:hypothetical protein
MTDKQINAAIAEACGWRKEDGVYMWTANGIDYTCPDLWDWANDLNAMHEALKTLKPHQLWDVAYSLPMETMLGFMATARELAETFLLVIGKWEGPTTEESSAVQEEEA